MEHTSTALTFTSKKQIQLHPTKTTNYPNGWPTWPFRTTTKQCV